MRPLATFPRHLVADIATPSKLREHGLSWRRARSDDLPFLRELYGTTRAEELGPVPWPEAFKQSFLDDQFALQHEHFVRHYADADFLVIEHEGQSIGRLYAMRRTDQAFCVVDIALLPAWRGRGLGSALIAQLQDEAQAHSRPLLLQVSVHNPAARRLYERLSFVAEGEEGAHQRMRWCGQGVS